MATPLDQQRPRPAEPALGDKVLGLVLHAAVEGRRLQADARLEPRALLLLGHALEEDLGRLGGHDPDECLDDLPAQVGRGRVQEVVADVAPHAGGRAEVVERALETLGRGPALRRPERGQRRGDVEDDRRLLVRQRQLRDLLAGERVAPGADASEPQHPAQPHQGKGTRMSGKRSSSSSSWPKYLYSRSRAVTSLPADPRRASCRQRFNAAISAAYESGDSPNEVAMICRSAPVKSTSDVVLSGADSSGTDVAIAGAQSQPAVHAGRRQQQLRRSRTRDSPGVQGTQRQRNAAGASRAARPDRAAPSPCDRLYTLLYMLGQTPGCQTGG